MRPSGLSRYCTRLSVIATKLVLLAKGGKSLVEPVLAGPPGEVAAAPDLQPGADVLQVAVDGAQVDVEATGDLVVLPALRHPHEHLDLAVREPERLRARVLQPLHDEGSHLG